MSHPAASPRTAGADSVTQPPLQPFALVIDRNYEGEGVSLACWNGSGYQFSDGDIYQRDGNTLAGEDAEFLTDHELECRLRASQQQPAWWPDTPEKVRAFIGVDYSALQWGQASGQPHEDDSYSVSAHDLMSAFATVAEWPPVAASEEQGAARPADPALGRQVHEMYATHRLLRSEVAQLAPRIQQLHQEHSYLRAVLVQLLADLTAQGVLPDWHALLADALGGTTAPWQPPPPAIFKFDPKKPTPDGFAAYTVMQLHAAHLKGVHEGLARGVAQPNTRAKDAS